jgi:hypothetical protein
MLVLRRDSVSIGNLRDGSKATSRCSRTSPGGMRASREAMSFHGGMQDQIVAERGDVAVNGERVERAVPAPR